MPAHEIRDRLRAALGERLGGWEPLEVEDYGLRLAAFRHPLDAEFAATAEVSGAFRTPDRPPVPVTGVSVGVSYEPLRALAPLLGLYGLQTLAEDVWPDEEMEVETAADAERAAERLAALIRERAVPFAKRYASVEALSADAAPLTRAAVLAAARRFGAARAALAQADPPERSRLTRADRRAVRQLRRWIDSGGDAELVPASPPPRRPRRAEPKSFAEVRSETAAERAALDEVKASGRDRSRPEARALLRAALARHGAPEQSPLWIESRLDHLWDSPTDQVQQGITLLKGAARLGLGVMKAIRERELPDLSPPEWLEPPDHALYEVPRTGRWIAAELDPAAAAWLDRVYAATPHAFGFATVTAWVRGSDVYLGEARVGQVPAEDRDAYAAVVADAAARDEHPCLDAHLARRDDGYLLEIARP